MQLPLHHLGGRLEAAGSRWGSRAQQPPAQPASACGASLAPDGWAVLLASWASRALAAARSLLPRWRLRPRPPGHSSLPSLFSRSFRVFRSPPGPSLSPAGPGECGSAGRPAIHRLCVRPLLPSPPRPAPVAGSSCRNQLCEESGNGRLPRQQRDTRCHCPGIWETSRSPPCSSLAFGPDHTGLDLITSPAVLKGLEGKSWLVPLSFPVLPESEPPAPA
ncbi:uncharacterized protein LOC105609488 [Ovis aries]|uniref:uncharacterized protein LOC105609488 n=1 Tax=Ovis aries TaxID=9940 RepID=UPI001C2E3EFF|nr:uncharacterized protein LOC105609488 [Ovis aries]